MFGKTIMQAWWAVQSCDHRCAIITEVSGSACIRLILAKQTQQTKSVKSISPRPARPQRAPNFSRKALVTPPVIVEADTNVGLQTKAHFCEHMLKHGYVESYVDFYHLTHRADPDSRTSWSCSQICDIACNRSVAANGSEIDVSVADMQFFMDSLVKAEQGRRSGKARTIDCRTDGCAQWWLGDTTIVYESFNKIADYYHVRMCVLFFTSVHCESHGYAEIDQPYDSGVLLWEMLANFAAHRRSARRNGGQS